MRLFAAKVLAPQERADACSGHGRACGATGSGPSSTPCPFLLRGRSDQLPSGAQLFFAVVFDWHLAASMSPSKVEQMMFLKLNQECLPEVQKYSRHCYAERKTQPMAPGGCAIGTRGGCWGDGGRRNIEELVRNCECMPKVEGVGDVVVREERC